jgi:hypothetical protein
MDIQQLWFNAQRYINMKVLGTMFCTWLICIATDVYLTTGNLLESAAWTGMITVMVWTAALIVLWIIAWISDKENGKKTL